MVSKGVVVGAASEVTACLLTGEAIVGDKVIRSGVQRGLFSIVMGEYLKFLMKTFSSPLPMLLFDQLVATWGVNALFVSSHQIIVQKKTLAEVAQSLKQMPQIVMSAILVWAPANTISLFWIPPRYRLYWGLFIGYLWGSYISVRAARARKRNTAQK